MSKVQQYIDDVLAGDVLVCELVRLAVERHLSDLKRQNTDEFPFYFDAQQAELVIDFFETVLVHTIGEFEDMPFILEPWQAFGVACIHGWRRLDGTRRFRRVYWSTARKNGKSSWGAGQALQLAAMDRNPLTKKPEAIAEVVLCATKRDQAKIIYKEALRQRKKAISLRELSTDINAQITFSHNGGYIFTTGSDKEYDGLNTHGVIKDELHAWKQTHRQFYNTIQTGGATRTQPLTITVTTAGDSNSAIWWDEYNHVRGVLRGVYQDEATFGLCFELDEDDDPFDESLWIKANPNLGGAVKIDYLREQATVLKHDELGRNVFKRYHGNRAVSSHETAISIAQWDACAGPLSDWKQADAVAGGVDLGGRDDLAAYGLVARFDTGETMPALAEGEEPRPIYRYEMRTQCYLANDTLRDTDAPPIAQWLHEDKIRQRQLPIHELQRDLIRECRQWFVYDVAFDPAQAQYFAEELEEQGVEAAAMGQTMTAFTEPINELRLAIAEGRFRHDGDPVLRWCVMNAVARQSGGTKVMFDKQKSSEKIDAIVAGTMAFRRAMLAPGRVSGAIFIS